MKFFILRNTVERCITLSLLKDNQISLTKWDISIKESDDHFLCAAEKTFYALENSMVAANVGP